MNKLRRVTCRILILDFRQFVEEYDNHRPILGQMLDHYDSILGYCGSNLEQFQH